MEPSKGYFFKNNTKVNNGTQNIMEYFFIFFHIIGVRNVLLICIFLQIKFIFETNLGFEPRNLMGYFLMEIFDIKNSRQCTSQGDKNHYQQ